VCCIAHVPLLNIVTYCTSSIYAQGAANFVYDASRPPPPNPEAQEALRLEKEYVKRRAVQMALEMYEIGMNAHRRVYLTVARFAKEVGDKEAEQLAQEFAESAHR
jgi:hypothetical protein|tara:strand:- start:326 stop:640 length:315 start_codon:yes stop_codon:yes gene_type:complete